MKSLIVSFVVFFFGAATAFAGNCGQAVVQRQVVHGHGHHAQVVERVVVAPVVERVRVVQHVEVPAERIIVRERIVNDHHHSANVNVVERVVVRDANRGRVNVDVNVGRRGFFRR